MKLAIILLSINHSFAVLILMTMSICGLVNSNFLMFFCCLLFAFGFTYDLVESIKKYRKWNFH